MEPASPAAGAESKSEAAEAAERLIYLPYRNLRDVLEKRGATVFLPYLEYLELWRQAGGAPPKAEQAPVDAVITEAHYVARVNNDLAVIDVALTIQVLGKPWAEVPIRFGNAAVGKLTSPDNKVLLRGTGEGTYSLLFPTPGDHKVQLELMTRVRTSPDGRSLAFDCPTVAVTTFELIIPEPDQAVELTPKLVSLPVEAAEKETRIKANLGATDDIAALWHPRTSRRPDMELLTGVVNDLQVSVEDGLIHTDASLNYEVLRGELTQVRIAVPLGHRVLGVESTDAQIKGWKAEDEPNRQVLTVEFLSSVRSRATVVVHTERPQPEAAFDVAGIDTSGVVHGVHALDVLRENGQLVVTHGSDLTLAVEQQRALVRIDEAEVHALIRRAGGLSYKFYGSDFGLKLSAKPIAPRITVDHQTRLVFYDDELRLKSDLSYTVERAGIFEARLVLPADVRLENVTGDNVKEHSLDAASRTLRVALAAKQLGSFAISVAAHRALDAKTVEQEQTLPILEPLDVERETGRILVHAPDAIEVVTDEARVKAAQPAPAQQVEQIPNTRLASAWTYTRRPVEIPVKTIRQPTRLTAAVGTTINVRQELVEVVTQLAYNVQYAGVDTFQFSVPAEVAKQINIRSLMPPGAPAIKQKAAAEQAEDGWVVWTVVLQRDVVGEQKFEVAYDIKPGGEKPVADEKADAGAEGEQAGAGGAKAAPAPGRTQGAEFVVQTIRALGLPSDGPTARAAVPLSQVTGELAVIKDRVLSVSASALDDNLEPIDIRELQLLPQTGTLAYRYSKQPVGVKVVTTRHEIQKVVETVVSRALVEIVIGRDQTAMYRCRYRLKSSQRQRLGLDLPRGSQLLGLLVDGKRVDPEKQQAVQEQSDWDGYFVNVSRSKRSDEEFFLTIQFQIGLASQFRWGRGTLALPMPRVGGREQADVVVQHLRAALWVPDEFALVGTPDRFVADTLPRVAGVGLGQFLPKKSASGTEEWIGTEASGIIDFPTSGNVFQYSSLGGADRIDVDWWHIPFFTWILSGTLVVVGFVLRKTNWENKLGAVLLASFLAALWSLSDSDRVLQSASAAQYGIVVMLAIWLLHGLLGTRNGGPPVAVGPPQSSSSDPTGAAAPPPSDLTAATSPANEIIEELRDPFRKK